VPHIIDERPVAPEEAYGAYGAAPGGRRRWQRRFLLPALALGVAACVVVLATGALDSLSAPTAQPAVADGGAGVVRVLASTGQVRAGPAFFELNGIADGLGGLWVTGGAAKQNHILFMVNPATGRIIGRVELPSRLVINPNDVAVGSNAVWVAVGASVYRIEPPSALMGGVATSAFAALPPGDVVGDLVVDSGALWASDTANGMVYRFAVSTGRLEAVIAVGLTAGAMAVGDGGVWVADPDARTVSRISVTSNRVDSVLTFPGAPSHIAASNNGLWVTDGTGSVAAALNSDHGHILTVPVAPELTGLAAIGDTVWVASTANGTLSLIDARRHVVVATVRVGTRPYAVAADRQGAWVALLGQPVMMHAPSGPLPSSAAQLPAWLLRLCGLG
jgi:YVTN family beta-propeller protein